MGYGKKPDKAIYNMKCISEKKAVRRADLKVTETAPDQVSTDPL
jgi:hypothetical protein